MDKRKPKHFEAHEYRAQAEALMTPYLDLQRDLAIKFMAGHLKSLHEVMKEDRSIATRSQEEGK